MKIIKPNSKEFRRLFESGPVTKKRVGSKVSQIIEAVRNRSDNAVLQYTRQFDKVKFTSNDLRVSEREKNASFGNLETSLILAIKKAIDNVTKFHKKQYPKNIKFKNGEGVKIQEKYLPLDRVGIYVPGGQAPLVSSVYMCAIPAIVAGVREIVLASPPNKEGFIDANILATASMLKIKEIYKVGGAQAIAALALGTNTIPRVDKVVGPGNEYVAEAKRQLFGNTGIDMIAGPSEVVILAGSRANVDFILKDLEAQTEHRKGLGIVITSSRRISRQLGRYNMPGSFLIPVKNLDQALDVVNQIAPEHLEIMMKKTSSILKKVRHAGAIFVGDYTPVAIGDYIAGPSHVLPTNRTARFSSGLSVCDFMKRTHIITYTKKALLNDADDLRKITNLERMKKHAESVDVRIK
jgi:histidinol dehydrogenase